MIKATAHRRTLPDFDVSARMLEAVDAAYLSFYAHMRRNARRLTRLAIAMIPLMMLLVGSCKTEQGSVISDLFAQADQLSAALFPDRAIARDMAAYEPAAGYVSRARGYVEGDPSTLTHLTQQEIGFLFGKPQMERRDADAHVWQYRSGACVVDFYFYDAPGMRTGESTVAYVDFRTRDELTPGAAPRATPVSSALQSSCLKKIAN